jgi:hypothetical protein
MFADDIRRELDNIAGSIGHGYLGGVQNKAPFVTGYGWRFRRDRGGSGGGGKLTFRQAKGEDVVPTACLKIEADVAANNTATAVKPHIYGLSG